MKSITVLHCMFFFICLCQRVGITVGANEGVWVKAVTGGKAALDCGSPGLRELECQPDGGF